MTRNGPRGRSHAGCGYGCGDGGRILMFGGLVTCFGARCGARGSRKRRVLVGAGHGGRFPCVGAPFARAARGRRGRNPGKQAKSGPTARGPAISMAVAIAGRFSRLGDSRWAQVTTDSGRGLHDHTASTTGSRAIFPEMAGESVAGRPTLGEGKGRMGFGSLKNRTDGSKWEANSCACRLRDASSGLKSPD